MSIIGLAHSPGTDVEPTCSIASTRSPSAATTRSRAASYHCGHAGSGATTSTGVGTQTPSWARAALMSCSDGVSKGFQRGWVRTR